MQRLTVTEAAEALGITTDAVRMRISRGTLDSERAEGRVYVLLEDDASPDRSGESSALISEMRDQIEFLRRELERRDQLLAAALSRIPEASLEAPRGDYSSPSEPTGAPETASEPVGRDTPFTDEERAQEAAEPRSWWRKIFG
jgi:excisionase family DNA binding protein